MSALHVLFKVGDADYVLAASDVLHMETFQGATKVPGSAPHVAGVMQIRRRVVPVVDVRTRFGLPAKDTTLDSRVVVVQSGERAVGLLVDSAREVLQLDDAQFQPPPDIVTRQAAGFVKAVAQAGERLLMLLDFEKLIGEENVHGVE